MTAKREKKTKKMRGTMSHGYGHKKKHRGAGSRGGRGMAGTGKRADVKKPSINPKTYFGKRGFTSKKFKHPVRAITIFTVLQKLHQWASQGKVQEKQGVSIVNLEALGFNRLLAKGKVTRKLHITVSSATPGAIERVNAAGGEITGLREVAADSPAEDTVPSAEQAPIKRPENRASAVPAKKPKVP
ncbi:MAG: 50S ribosomal protein L15 [DPANN group archaeon]|nr:50S ribosomal protein L15 [DPANN group archaeon]